MPPLMTITLDSFPSVDRYGFPLQVCGRCGGSGEHSYNQLHGSVCYGCNGHGVRHTKKAHKEFQDWAHALKCQREAIGHSLQVGDELAILQSTGLMTTKVVGWHSIASIETTDEECGWSITCAPDGTEQRTPTCWTIIITFDDGEQMRASTNSVFRRKGWVDPAPYVERSQVKRRAKTKV